MVAVVTTAARRLHEVGFYRSDAEFGALIVPFVEEGLAVGHPLIIGYDDRKASLLRSWVSDPGAVTFITGSSLFPIWSRCLYDAGTAAPRVLDIAERTHPRVVLPSGLYQPSGRYQDPAVFEPLPPDPDPLERSEPALVLTDPSAFQARQVVSSIAHGRLVGTIRPDLVIGVSEAVSNAWRHGRPPVTVRIWTAPSRMLVRVHDTVPGPGNPLAGLAPAWAGPGLRGAGLWLIRMLGLDAALIRSRDGFTVRLAAGQLA